MIKLYRDKPILFAILWIVIYVVGFSLSDSVSSSLGMEKSVTLVLGLVLSAALYFWISRQNLKPWFGLCPSAVPARRLLWYVPLGMLLTVNLWLGAVRNLSIPETIFYILSMLCVGFLEELIFRGMLFQAMLPGGVKSAVLVSSLTFGMGHLVNLFNSSGAALFAAVLQVVYAAAIGFLFSILFYKTKSLWACIITHGIFNALSVFANEDASTPAFDFFSAAFLTVVAVGYAVYILCIPPDLDKDAS